MRTTLNLDDELMAEAKAMALRQRATLSRLIEDAVRAHPGRCRPPEGWFELPLGDGRLAADADLTSPEATAAWLRRFDVDA